MDEKELLLEIEKRARDAGMSTSEFIEAMKYKLGNITAERIDEFLKQILAERSDILKNISEHRQRMDRRARRTPGPFKLPVQR